MALSIAPYAPADAPRWDDFVHGARNGHFLFARGYMDYHAARFPDASRWLLPREGGPPLGLWPAHRCACSGAWVSHGGLTFGGLVLHPRTGVAEVLEGHAALADTLRAEGFSALRVRPLAHPWQQQPAMEELHALVQLGARCVQSDVCSVIDLEERPAFAARRRRALAKARRAGLVVRECATAHAGAGEATPAPELSAYWNLLEAVLEQRHGVRPVHTLAEIAGLAARHPGSIRLHAAFGAAAGREGPMLAGVLSFVHARVWHTQYLACGDEGRECGALDAVLAMLIEAAPQRFFSFGTCTQDGGRVLNAGLAAQKEEFGARGVVFQTWELTL
jgi:hypothetical protein